MHAHTTIDLRSGRSMPVLGLGTWQLTDSTDDTVEEALDLGYRLIDTSGDYGTQPGVGEALRKGGPDRERIFLVTKVEEDEDSYAATRRNLDELDQEYVDLMLVHRPPENGAGIDLWRGLIRARDEGLARDIGVSNYSIEQMEALAEATGELPVVNQIEWSPFGWSPEMLDWCNEREVVLQAYSPLTRAERLDAPVLVAIAEDLDATPAQVLLRWDIQRGVVPLPKSSRREHLRENIAALDLRLTDDQMHALDQLNEEWSALGDRPQYL